jgi:hypothetical protein
MYAGQTPTTKAGSSTRTLLKSRCKYRLYYSSSTTNGDGPAGGSVANQSPLTRTQILMRARPLLPNAPGRQPTRTTNRASLPPKAPPPIPPLQVTAGTFTKLSTTHKHGVEAISGLCPADAIGSQVPISTNKTGT